jgi:TDG/mug DNA glycosylase family protein
MVKPTRADLDAAAGATIPDVIARELDVLFCGINPGLYTAAVGHHFGRPGNRFWPTLHRAGFTPRLFAPAEQRELLKLGYGITNIVARKVTRWKPRSLAIVGIGAYRTAFARPRAKLGLQPETIGTTKIWVLPNPSGLNANYQPEALAKLFRELKDAAGDS